MKYWYCYLFKEEKDFINQVINNSISSNRLYSYDIKNNQLKFYSDFGPSDGYVLTYNYQIINNYDKLLSDIENLVEKSHKLAAKIATTGEEGQDYSIKKGFEGTVSGIISSIINKSCYEPMCLLDFLCTICIRIAIKHIWNNGNKRTSIVLLSKLLEYFGFKLKYSSSEYISNWEQTILDIVSNEELGVNKKSENELIEYLKDKIKDSIWMNYNSIK
jgi:death-on-curing family protein